LRRFCVLLLAGTPAVWGQATVEYGLGAASVGTAGAGHATSKALTGIFQKVTETLNSVDHSKPPMPAAPQFNTTMIPLTGGAVSRMTPGAAAATPAQPAVIVIRPAEPPKPAVVYEDPAGIQVGMERAELVRRFGEPTMGITTGAGREAFTYETKDRRLELELRDGKVASVASKTRPKQTAVVVLQ
jgi:hypothetical protein